MLQTVPSSDALAAFLRDNNVAIVTFSAHWCGPCKASKPQLEQLAQLAPVPMAIAYEDVVDVHAYNIRAFPTYVVFQSAVEQERVEGVQLSVLEGWFAKYNKTVSGEGHALGGSSVADPQAARLARLARLEQQQQQQQQQQQPSGDVEMKDAPNKDEDTLKALQEMGFSLEQAQKGLERAALKTVEGVVEWIAAHPEGEETADDQGDSNMETVAQSYICNDCGKILSSMANLEMHAHKTGHSDFGERSEQVQPKTPEEVAEQLAKIKDLLAQQRAAREAKEKAEEITREKARRTMGQEMAKTREQMEIEKRKRDAVQRRKEKEAFKKERERIRAELAKDKAERQANQGKLASKLGVDGYNPDAIQYDDGTEEQQSPQPKKPKASAARIDEYIEKVSSYKAGGDGGKCLKVLKAYVGNVVDHPDDDKFRTIKTDNKVYTMKVKHFVGAKNLLLAVGFKPNTNGTELNLEEDPNMELLAETKEKLEKAIVAYG